MNLFVCSVGGHLTELLGLAPRFEGIDGERMWVTFDTPQSRSMLAGEDVLYLDYAGPRDVSMLLRHTGRALRLLSGGTRFSTVISTGSGIALSFLPLARARGASCHYIESATRSVGPSVTGRALRRVPGIHLYTQYAGWARGPWRYSGSVLDSFEIGPVKERTQIRRAVVTVGTMEDYEFRRLIDRARQILPRETEVLWQVGCTEVSDLPIDSRRQLPAGELRRAIEQADVVIAHAGCGSSLGALTAGKLPVLVPREQRHGENIDDHQTLIARELSARALAVVRTAEKLTLEDLQRAARSSVISVAPGSFALAGRTGSGRR